MNDKHVEALCDAAQRVYQQWERRKHQIQEGSELEKRIKVLRNLSDNALYTHPPADLLTAEITAMRERIAELEEATRWIPVSERLPDERVYVITLDPMFPRDPYHVFYRTTEYDVTPKEKHTPFWVSDTGSSATITHWMSLPAPPTT